MTIPKFAASCAALATVLIFVGVWTIEQAYGALIEGKAWTDMSLPLWAIAALILASAAVAAITAWFFAREFQNVLVDFTRYLEVAQIDPSARLSNVSFVELRRLRSVVIRSVGKLRRDNDALRRTAYEDPRTGMPNLIALEEHITKTLPRAKYETPAALIVLDLDNFTRASERLGALASEAVLKACGQRMTTALDALEGPVRTGLNDCMLAAMQADSFALYLPSAVSRDYVSNIARAIRLAFADPFIVSGQSVTLGISGGIVIAPEDADTMHKLFRHAELALRQVRNDTGSGFRYFSPRLNRVARGKYMLEAELRDAVANREFKTHFQPKIDFQTGQVVGAEALARWIRPNGKIISPNTFIPLAEETGLVNQIGEQVLEAACESARIWMQEGFNATVAVNVSPRQFQASDLTETVLAILKRTGLPPNRLELEITESMAVSEPEKVARVMRPLRSLGTKLAIDDFGTGHSNLSILTQLPFDVFKIDRQFVSALESDEQAPAIIEMILAMAETLGLNTVAEGVETERQADFLRRRGCSMAQGFLYSAGLPHEAFMDFIRGWSSKTQAVRQQVG
ncbi:putative bifunctional diguanylate cyclase/phosphodiesterase [Hyphomonas sp.]|uniref:putative bifunctional diguanylate cyclase/phosphodiesterase n=1 Tax=Hyphomonas sp. TaxID=87 RepID=UPI003003A0B3|tara:strand:- start:175 stop:1887 length:1713 start_codon:yes stop_codon:yes gene_type:complete|eukprot:TRINITY_DN20839_c0_g1_i1.p1 TRINITY_DN20839_c0_g1~~TRINITY_DN20839_c0_g1_i1.p1  ORF type:complete len:571 (-),score=113.64 TRINITY_DN20839_c0_g1_i1:4837-6549(-)